MKPQSENHAAAETSAVSTVDTYQPKPSLDFESVVREVKQGAKPSTPTPQSQILDILGVAALIGVTVSCLRKWKRQGRGPTYFRAGKLIRYRRVDVENWIAQYTVPPRETSDQAREGRNDCTKY